MGGLGFKKQSVYKVSGGIGLKKLRFYKVIDSLDLPFPFAPLGGGGGIIPWPFLVPFGSPFGALDPFGLFLGPGGALLCFQRERPLI